jgi:xanthine dehydrogenase YagS FAD-binding subunit
MLVAGPAGERRIPVREFYTPLGNRLGKDEMLREIEVPAVTGLARQIFSKFTLRRPIDFAIVSVAAVATVADGVCSDARIALGAIAPGAHRAVAAEAFLQGRAINQDTAAQAGELALQGAKPLSRNAYKIEIAKTLVTRAILGLLTDSKQNTDDLTDLHGYDPAELSTFHRCGPAASSELAAVPPGKTA